MIKLNLKNNVFVPKHLPFLLDYSHRFEFWIGSAGSGKSYSIAQKLIIRCCNEQIKVLVCRRYGTTLRNTCFSLFKEILTKWKLAEYVKIRESDFNIKFPNGSEIIMMGLDEETKLLSLNNIGTVWIEEAFEVSRDIVEQLNLRMRSKNENQQIIMSFNPISKNSWLYDFVEINAPENSIKLHSTYKDNPFLSDAYIKELDNLITRNPQKARVFCFGDWGVNPDGLVFSNWRAQEFDPLTLPSGFEHRCGMDLGYHDPSSIVDTLYDAENKTIYVFNVFYKRGCQLSELVEQIKAMNLTKSKLAVDSAEPRTIQFFKSNGINAVPCSKGKDSVKAGIMFLQDNTIIVHPSCIDLINELENFSYIKSKQTGEYTDDTTHEFSHSIDALRYGYSDIYTNTKLKTFDKKAFGF